MLVLKFYDSLLSRVNGLTDEEAKKILQGKTLEIYRFLVKANKPVGIREVQRALKLRSPSTVAYHFTKLEEAGLIKREQGDYVVSRFILSHSIRIRQFIVPRQFFYAAFAIVVLMIELTMFRPIKISREYFFSITTTLVFVVFFVYETVMAWNRGEM